MLSTPERINTYPANLRFPTPPTATAEKFIGQLGCNLLFHTGEDDSGQSIYCSSYDIIARLSLKLGDPRVDVVRATFSNLTHWMEIRALTGTNIPMTQSGQLLAISAEVSNQASESFRKLHAQNKKIPAEYDSFVLVFSKLLTNQGMADLAAKLNP